MIRFLSIQDFAVVDSLELELQPGLTVLTGETGAGKSVVIGALASLVGGRSSGDLVRTGETRARVQATVEDESGRDMIIRREIGASGRSRAFIDDSLATVSALQQVGLRLVDLHGQHEHQELLNPDSHVDLLDAFAGVNDDREKVRQAFRRWQALHARLEQARRHGRDKTERVDLLTFQRDEIDEVAPVPDEHSTLSNRRTRLVNAERLASLTGQAYAQLYEEDDAILTKLGQVWRQLEELAALDSQFATHVDGRVAVVSQLEDLAFFLRSYGTQIDASPEELSTIEERLSKLEHLNRRYGPTHDDVIKRRAEIEAELSALTATEEELDLLSSEDQEAREAFLHAAGELSVARRSAASRLSDDLAGVLRDLAIPLARIESRFNEERLPESDWTERGIDRIEFYFSANPGEATRPLRRVASGGELSRVMLGLKTLATTDLPGKTLVFDEVDAGIGGAVADRVGHMLKRLAERYQVICVTHLPQIAAYATSHHRVSKTVERGRTVTRIDELTEEGRVSELARLMTGGETPGARAGAKELLASKQNSKGESERRKRKVGRRG